MFNFFFSVTLMKSTGTEEIAVGVEALALHVLNPDLIPSTIYGPLDTEAKVSPGCYKV